MQTELGDISAAYTEGIPCGAPANSAAKSTAESEAVANKSLLFQGSIEANKSGYRNISHSVDTVNTPMSKPAEKIDEDAQYAVSTPIALSQSNTKAFLNDQNRRDAVPRRLTGHRNDSENQGNDILPDINKTANFSERVDTNGMINFSIPEETRWRTSDEASAKGTALVQGGICENVPAQIHSKGTYGTSGKLDADDVKFALNSGSERGEVGVSTNEKGGSPGVNFDASYQNELIYETYRRQGVPKAQSILAQTRSELASFGFALTSEEKAMLSQSTPSASKSQVYLSTFSTSKKQSKPTQDTSEQGVATQKSTRFFDVG